MPIKLKVFIQMSQKSQDRHKTSFAFEFNNKNIKKVFGSLLALITLESFKQQPVLAFEDFSIKIVMYLYLIFA